MSLGESPEAVSLMITCRDKNPRNQWSAMLVSMDSSVGPTLLTPQVPQQRVQFEASEVGGGGKHGARSVWRGFEGAGQGDGARAYGEEADEDGAQDEHDHQEDEERGLGVDVRSHQAHQQTQQGDGRGVKQRIPVARRQHLVVRECGAI